MLDDFFLDAHAWILFTMLLLAIAAAFLTALLFIGLLIQYAVREIRRKALEIMRTPHKDKFCVPGKGGLVTHRRPNGQYDYGNMDLLCVCGHRLGVHAAAYPRDCFNEDTGATGHPCACKRFRKVRIKKLPAERIATSWQQKM